MVLWKFLISGGLLSLVLGSVLMMVVLHRFLPFLSSRKTFSLRDQHKNPIPRFGGFAMAWSFWMALSLLIWLPFDKRGMGLENLPLDRLTGLLLGSLLAWGIGMADDLWSVRARWKLLGQIGLGVLVVYFGFSIKYIEGPFFQYFSFGIWSLPLTVLWVVGVINAINLIDGLDGLAGGVILVSLSVLLWLAQDFGKFQLMLLMVVLIGSVFSFWTFNRPPASIFMGDSGSYFLGFTIALLSLWVCQKPNGSYSLLPLLILAVPLIDTLFALFRRFLKGIPFYSADKDHLHHRLIAKGMSPSKAMISLVGVSLVYGAIALGAHFWPFTQTYAYLGGITLAWLLLYLLEYDVIRKPVSSIRGQKDHRKRRDLMIALAEQMDDFLAKDDHVESVLNSFSYWCSLAGINKYQVLQNGKPYQKQETFETSLRIIIIKFEDWEIHLGLPRESWRIDSDVKADLIEKASEAFSKRLKRLESPKVVEMKQ